MMKRQMLVFAGFFFGSLQGVPNYFDFNKKGECILDVIQEDAQGYVKNYNEIFACDGFDLPHIKLNGNAVALTAKELAKAFSPCMVLGDYEPMRKFFYDEVDLFHISKHKPIENFLRNNPNDPVCIYFYLRWWSKYGKKDLVDESIKELWYKRYLAELLIEFDCCLLNISQNNEFLIQHVRSIINLFRYRLEQRVEYAQSPTLTRKDILCSVRDKLAKRLKWTEIKLHGDPRWLLTSQIKSGWNFRKYFNFEKPTDDHPMIQKYGALQRTSEEQFIQLQSCTALFIQNLDGEIARLP